MKKHLLFFWALTVLLMPGVQSCDDSSEGGSAPAELTVTPNPLTVGADGGPQELSCLVENPNGGSVRASSSGATWIFKGDNETYIEGPTGNDDIILYDNQMRDRPRTRRTKRNV